MVEHPQKRQKVNDLNEAELRTYTAQRVLGLGSFGVVYQAQVIETGEIVAIKAMKLTERDKEIQVLREFIGHPNIVQLKGAFVSKEEADPKLNLVMDFCSDTLHRVIKHNKQLDQHMDALRVKLYQYQLLRGLNFVHMKGIVHCDIKPQNLLLDGKSHTLKLCDFGTARRLVFGDMTLRSYMCSRYYRAPELILGSISYDTSVDIWSAGCVYGEMLLGQPLFTGKDGINQLVEIIKVLGTPTSAELQAMNPHYPEYKFTPEIPKIPWEQMFPRLAKDRLTMDMVNSLLRYDPSSRLTPMQGLLHEYFETPLRTEKSKNFGPPLFNFHEDELWLVTPEERKRLIP
jgi:serine/threonine protein kinase